MKPACRQSVLVLLLAGALASAPSAFGEEVVLKSGTRYDASVVDVLPGADATQGDVRFTVLIGSGAATLVLPYDRIDPESLLGLVAARTDLTKGAGHLALARLALSRGLYARATASFRRAAELDPALAGERDAGIVAIRDDLAKRALVEAEADMKRGRSDMALEKARAVAVGRAADDPIAVRARGVAELAERLVERERTQREAKVAAETKAAAEISARLLESTLARVDELAQGAVLERERASDPDLSGPHVLRALEAAEGRLKEARRLLASLDNVPAEAQAEVTSRDDEIVQILVDDYLDLADLHRVTRRFDRARAYARAAGILAPDDVRVRDVRDRIDRDAAAPPPEEYYPENYGYGWGGYAYRLGLGWPGVVVTRRYPNYVRRPYGPRPALRGPGNLPSGW
jgi:tetratricopeptide (TPR) repeat protein